MQSPFRWPGGKYYARSQILESLPSHETYAEVFCGGGSIYFAKPHAERTYLNDLDEELINTFIQIRDSSANLIELIKNSGVLDGRLPDKDMHRHLKNEFKPQNDLERAYRYFVLNRISFSGIMRRANCYFAFDDRHFLQPSDWIGRIREASVWLQQAHLTSMDFEEFLEWIDDGSFVFVDPPYWGVNGLYEHEFDPTEHQRLAACLRRHADRLSFLLTYDDAEEVRHLYDWCEITDHTWSYRVNRSDDQRKIEKKRIGKGNRTRGQELFISNYRQPRKATTLEEWNKLLNRGK